MTSTDRPTTVHVDLDREWRGGQRQVLLLTTELAERGLPTHLVTRPGTELARRLVGTRVKVHELPYLGEWDLSAAAHLRRLLREVGADVVAAHASHAHGLAALATRRGGPPLVVHRRVDFPIGTSWFNRRKYAAPAAYIAISERVREFLIAGGVPAAKITVVSSGVPAHRPVADARAKLAAACKLREDVPWVGDVASFVEHKGHRHLIEAWAMLRGHGVDAKLILIGDGPLRGALEQQVGSLGIGDSVRFVGWREDIDAWLSALDVFVMTSVTEGLCTAILDAMAARVPVVATAAGGIVELVRHRATGYLAPVGDAMAIADGLREAIFHREHVAVMAGRAYDEIWRQRSVENMADRTLRTYRELTTDDNSMLLKKKDNSGM